MKKNINLFMSVLIILISLLLTSCSEKDSDVINSQIENNGLDLSQKVDTGSIDKKTLRNEINITDIITVVSIKSPSEYVLLSENLKGEKKEFNFYNEHLESPRYITSRLDKWQDKNMKSCYISELQKQVYYYMTNNSINLDNLTYEETGELKGIVKVSTGLGDKNIGDILYEEGYLFNFDVTNSDLLCKCDNINKNISYNHSDSKYKLSFINDDLSFSLISASGESIKFIEKNLSKLKMTAGLKSDCYLDMLKSQIKYNLNNKEFILGNYDNYSKIGEIILDNEINFSLIDLLQKQGFIENECNTNDIDPTLMLYCQKAPN